jgi:hypothetical protein
MVEKERPLASLIRKFWCRRVHCWVGWELTPEERERIVNPVSFGADGRVTIHGVQWGRWSRKDCRFCRGLNDEMPRRHIDRYSSRARRMD